MIYYHLKYSLYSKVRLIVQSTVDPWISQGWVPTRYSKIRVWLWGWPLLSAAPWTQPAVGHVRFHIPWRKSARKWCTQPTPAVLKALLCISPQLSSVAHLCLTLCDPVDCSTSGFPVHHQSQELAQTHVHQVGDAIQPSHPLSSPPPPTFSLSQHWGLFQGVSSSHQVAKVLEFQCQHQSFQWIFRTDFL